jgi:hypothetical protein
MEVPLALVSVALAGLVTFAAVRKLSHRPDVVRGYADVGVPENRLDLLAAILLAGAAGLLVGLLVRPIGIAASAGLVAYFALAIGAHLRTRQVTTLPPPVVLEVLAVAALALNLRA